MERTPDELEALTKFGLKDFKGYNKSKLIEISNKLDSMNPIVAAEALKQFPEFAKSTLESLKSYIDLLRHQENNNNDIVVSISDAYLKRIDNLQKQLEKPDFTREEMQEINDLIQKCFDDLKEIDIRNKKFLSDSTRAAFNLAALSIVAGAVTLGAKFFIPIFKK